MKKISFLSVFALLGIISLIVWGCGGWFAHKNDKQQQTQTDTAGLLAKADSLLAQNLPIDSFILSKRKGQSGLVIELDTTKCDLLPEPSMDNLLTHPTYRAIFELGNGMEITTIKGEIDPFVLAYKGIKYQGSNFTFSPLIINDCLVRLSRDHFVPQHEPSDIKLSRIEALEIALKQEYPTRAQYFKAKFGKYVDRIPVQHKYLLVEKPIDSVVFKKNFRPNAKFSWQRLDPEQYLADSLFQYSQGELLYSYGGDSAKLEYKFIVYSIRGEWVVFINAVTGEVFKDLLDKNYTACPIDAPTAYTSDYLWYYNSVNPKPLLNLSKQSTSDIHRFWQLPSSPSSHTSISAFCRSGTFELNSLGLTEAINTYYKYRNDIDWYTPIENHHERAPRLAIDATTTLPTAYSTTGLLSLQINPDLNTTTTSAYTYIGTHLIAPPGVLLNGTSIDQLSAGTVSVGIYAVEIQGSGGICSNEYLAVGTNAANSYPMTATIIPADCYGNQGDLSIRVKIPNGDLGGQTPKIAIRASESVAMNTLSESPFSATDLKNIVGYTFDPNGDGTVDIEFKLSQFNDIAGTGTSSINNLPLPSGNYAVFFFNPSNNKVAAGNFRLNYPDCERERKILQTAYWAIQRTDNFFRGTASAINGGMAINPLLNTPDILSTEGIPAINPFTNSNPNIAIALVDDPVNNALHKGDIGGFTQFKVAKGSNPNYPMASLEIMAHEYAHAVNAQGANVNTSSSSTISEEAAAISEGFSDIVGCMVEAMSKPLNWSYGDDLVPNNVFIKRHINNPLGDYCPSIYKYINWTDYEEYVDSRVFSYWFYLLSQGDSQMVYGTTRSVSGIGIEKAFKIVMAAFTSDNFGLQFDENKNYHGLSKATLKAAHQMYGACSAEVRAVRQAWLAVGLDPWATVEPPLEGTGACDLMLPYIKSVKITNNSETITYYHAEWELNHATGKMCLKKQVPGTSFSWADNQTIKMVVNGNEPLSTLNFLGFVGSAGLVNSGYTSGTPVFSNSGKTWTALLTKSVGTSPIAGSFRLKFSGTDLAGNSLLNLESTATCNPASTCACFGLDYGLLPQRNSSSTAWSTGVSTGDDTVHKIALLACPSTTAPESDFCDNSLPYLRQMRIVILIDGDEAVLDNQQWQETDDMLCFYQEDPSSFINFNLNNPITLRVEASEPLAELHLERMALGAVSYPIESNSSPLFLQSQSVSTDGTIWDFVLQYDNQLVYNNLYVPDPDNPDAFNLNAYRLYFSGTDLTGNGLQPIESFEDYDQTERCLPNLSDNMPYRTATGEWSARYDGTDSGFHFNIDSCPEVWFNQEITYGFANIIPGGASSPPIVAYSIIDNATGTYLLDHQPIHTPTDATYNNDNILASTLGQLPNSYTLVAIYADGCQKVMLGETPEPPCTFDSYAIGSSTQADEGEYTLVTSNIVLPFDVGYPCTVSISGGSINSNSANGGNPITLLADGGSTQQLHYRVLNSELNYPFAYIVTDANACKSKGILRPSNVAVSGTVVFGGSQSNQSNTGSICARGTLCFNYEVQSQEPLLSVVCDYPSAVVTILSDEVQIDGQTYRQTGTVCLEAPDAPIGTDYTISVVAQPLEGLSDTMHYELSIADQLTLTASVQQHARSVCGEEDCSGIAQLSVTGGSGSYDYRWSNQGIGSTATQLCGGNYSVTANDLQTGCTASAVINIGIIVTSGNTEVVTYTAAAELIKPDIRLAPALFDSQTKVEYTLPEDGFVTIKVYNLQGILVETLVSNEYRTAGNYQLNDEGGEYANGLYLFSLEMCNRNKAVIGIKW